MCTSYSLREFTVTWPYHLGAYTLKVIGRKQNQATIKHVDGLNKKWRVQ